ncbi:MAG: Gfo/Idh/MocA family oxidoreductase [Cyanobacteria bacterium P01_H01_bin.15]
MKKTVKLAILGAGRWGTHLIRNFFTHAQSEVVAIADPDPARLEACREKFQLGATVSLVSDWRKLQKISDLDAVVVVTPASTHLEIIEAALNWGCHILAEKPLTLEASTCEHLAQLAQSRERILMVDHTYLFHPAVEVAKSAIAAGKLGDIQYGYATRTNLGPVRQDVDALWDLAIHDIAIFNYWLDATPTRVEAQSKMWLQPESADWVQGTMFYPNDIPVKTHWCWANPDKQRRLGLVGSEGTLIFDELASSPVVIQQGHFIKSGEKYLPENLETIPLAVPPAEPLAQMCAYFLDCVLSGRQPERSDAQVGKALVQILAHFTEALN